MFNVLQTRGVPSKLLTFPDENHVSCPHIHQRLAVYPFGKLLTQNIWSQWVLKPENSLVWHREVLDWINKYSGLADKASSNVTGGERKDLRV